MSSYTQSAMTPEEIDKLRFLAFKTNKKEDQMAYYKAASGYFQDRHVREMNRADLPATNAQVKAERVAAALWKSQVVDAGSPQSVIEGRTPEAFADEGPELRGRWLKYARAALAVLEADT